LEQFWCSFGGPFLSFGAPPSNGTGDGADDGAWKWLPRLPRLKRLKRLELARKKRKNRRPSRVRVRRLSSHLVMYHAVLSCDAVGHARCVSCTWVVLCLFPFFPSLSLSYCTYFVASVFVSSCLVCCWWWRSCRSPSFENRLNTSYSGNISLLHSLSFSSHNLPSLF
jgi:hypothetical protein